MRFGVLEDFRNLPGSMRPPAELYSQLIEQVVLVEELGFDDVWLTEHHFIPGGYSSSPLMEAAAIAVRTSRIRIGTYVLLMPFAHPVRLAEDVAAVDILSNGRFDLGIGQGYVHAEFDGFAIPRSERAQRMEEGIVLLQRLFEEENVHFEGRFTQVGGATLSPKPIQQPGPPVWIGARGEKAIRRAARLGCHLMCTLGPDPAPMYISALEDEGRDPKEFSIAQLRVVYVAETEDQAWEECGPYLKEMINFYAPILSQAADVPGDTEFRSFEGTAELRDSEFGRSTMIGNPDQVSEKLREFQANFQASHLAMATQFPGMDPAVANESLKLFAREVMPEFKDS
ncbi:MAG TPA: LLM class flavin-dependent oxidoreductase [Pseudonocardia sp.]|jgi:alkanesulfonate monooxygenase SsuD/methylene tetrahydromethanopterin reductase-like flavin-dependent oxidoreductase (luciferase family)|nr:LLM class flavin-dependent oxidoreductase [Pseudonocardia sp.]